MGILALFLAVLPAGCAGRSRGEGESLQPPGLNVSVDHFAGSVLSGPSPALTAAPPGDPRRVEIQLYWLSTPPPPGETLGARARLILANRSGVPVQPSTQLVAGGQILVGDAAANALGQIRSLPPTTSARLPEQATALPENATAVITVAADAPTGVPMCSLMLSRTVGDTYVLGVRQRDLTREPTGDAEEVAANPQPSFGPPPPVPMVAVEETAIVDLAPGTSGVYLTLPVRFPNRPGEWLVAACSIGPASAEPAFQEQLEAAQRNIVAAAERAMAGTKSPDPSAAARESFIAAALIGQDAARRRPAITFLAADVSASIAADLALAADDAMLERFAQRVTDQSKAGGARVSAEQWSLTLDLIALRLLAEAQAAGALAPELESILSIHTGESGRHSGTLDEVVQGVAHRSELDARLTAENLIYLEDNSPAARVRAFDWLRGRGVDLAGYDPFATPRQRAAALEVLMSQLGSTNSATGTPTPRPPAP